MADRLEDAYELLTSALRDAGALPVFTQTFDDQLTALTRNELAMYGLDPHDPDTLRAVIVGMHMALGLCSFSMLTPAHQKIWKYWTSLRLIRDNPIVDLSHIPDPMPASQALSQDPPWVG